MEFYTCKGRCWPTSKELHTSALCRHWIQSRGEVENRDGETKERVKRLRTISIMSKHKSFTKNFTVDLIKIGKTFTIFYHLYNRHEMIGQGVRFRVTILSF